jgi:hypothetical protein
MPGGAPLVLIVAGSDSVRARASAINTPRCAGHILPPRRTEPRSCWQGGGAGIQADLKACEANGA